MKKIFSIIFLIVISIALISSFSLIPKIGKITIKVTDQNGRPLKGAIVQLTGVTSPENKITSITILNKTTDAKGEVSIKFQGILKTIAKAWKEHLKGKPKINIGIFVSVFYETEKGLYISDGWVINYNPRELEGGKHYQKLIKIDLTQEPTLSREKLDKDVQKRKIHTEDFALGPYIYAWKLEEYETYPEQVVGEIPVAWADARTHSFLEGHFISVNFGGSVTTKGSLGIHAGISLASGITSGSAQYTFKLGESVISSYEIYFGDGWYVKPGKFTWIYIKGQAAYEAWQLYKVSVSGLFPDIPLDEWKFQVYMRDIEVKSDGEIVGGHHLSDTPPSSISYLYSNERGMVYDYYDTYSSDSVHKINFKELRDAYVEVNGIPLELGLSLGLIFASTAMELILPFNILAGLSASIVAEGSAYATGYIKFESSGYYTRVYVSISEFLYEYRTSTANYYYHFPVAGFKLVPKFSSGGSGGGGGPPSPSGWWITPE